MKKLVKDDEKTKLSHNDTEKPKGSTNKNIFVFLSVMVSLCQTILSN